MTQERAPKRAQALVGAAETTPWELARTRLENWLDGAMLVVAGEGTRKARNIAADGRC